MQDSRSMLSRDRLESLSNGCRSKLSKDRLESLSDALSFRAVQGQARKDRLESLSHMEWRGVMSEHKLFYRRHLPHYQLAGATIFVTWRLYGSIPRDVLNSLLEEAEITERKAAGLPLERRTAWLRQERKKAFARSDAVLDRVDTGPNWLSNEEVASIVAQSLHYLDGRKYELIAYCIMPNHVHAVFTPLPIEPGSHSYHTLASIMQSLKGYTAREANRVLNRKGRFWQDESYDHVVRDEQELERIVSYVLNNPVKAGLVETPDQWRWSYCRWHL